MIKVLIERQIAEGLEGAYEMAIRQVIQAAVNAPGFISGEAFADLQRPNHRVVIVTMRDLASWQVWHQSPERLATVAVIQPMLEDEERITLLEPL